MKPLLKTYAALPALLATLAISSCTNTPMPIDDPGSSADSQRSRSSQAQDELSRETAK